MRLTSAVVTDKGLSQKRPVNEDSYLELPSRNFFAVADGVGGAQAGDFASSTAMEVVAEAFSHADPNIDSEELLEMAIKRANASIYQMSHELAQLETMATTIVAMHIVGNIATLAHVGDSRIYRLDPAGNLHRETHDHSLVEEEVRAGRMTPAQAANHPSRNVISRALGADEDVEVELRTIMFEPNTTFLLCSDGVTTHLDDPDIRDVLLKNKSLTAACDEIKAICYARGAEDNLTALLVRIESAEQTAAAETGNLDDDETTIAAARPVFAPNPLPMLTNNSGSFAAESKIADVRDLPPVSPVANTAPLENLPPYQTEDQSFHAQTNQLLTPASQTIGVAANSDFNTSSAATLPDKIDNERIRSKINEAVSYNADSIDHESKSVSVGKVLWALVFLLIGAALGAAALILFNLMQSPVSVPPVETTTATPIQTPTDLGLKPEQINEFKMFEIPRRTIDSQPARELETGATPASAADFYLRGRALLQVGRFEDARTALLEAETRLATDNNDVSKETLRVDIAVAQAAVSAMTNANSTERMLREIVTAKGQTPENQPR